MVNLTKAFWAPQGHGRMRASRRQRLLRALAGVFSAPAIALPIALAIGAGSSAAASTFEYSYANPFDAHAQTYIHSTSNVSLYSEATVRLWKPNVGAGTLAGTTPGIITYKFDFGSDIVESARLRTNNPTFHWSYSQGYNKFFGSKDGVIWEQILDVPPPAFGSANSGFFDGLLPATLLGGTQLWFRAELYSYGPSASRGSVLTNTAQHSRWDVSQGSSAKTFALSVDFKDATTPPAVPLPASLPMLAFGFVLLRVMRRKSDN